MGLRRDNDVTFLTAVGAVATGTAKDGSAFRNATFALAAAGTATLKVQLQGSIQKIKPDFSDTATATNVWTYIQSIDLENGSPVNGEDGVTFTGSNSVVQLAGNIDGMRWVNARVTEWTAGTVTVTGYLFSND